MQISAEARTVNRTLVAGLVAEICFVNFYTRVV